MYYIFRLDENVYGTAKFSLKTRIKTLMVLEALKLGYTVVMMDPDIVFFYNPLPFLNCSECDMQASIILNYF